MTRIVKGLVGLVIGVVVLYAAAGVALKLLVSGSSKDRVLASVSRKTGVNVDVASADFDLGAWFRLQPAIALHQVTVANPEGFPSPHLLEAETMSAQVRLLTLLSDQPEVVAVNIEAPRVHIDSNSAGMTNLEVLMKRLSSGGGAAGGGGQEAAAGAGLAVQAVTLNDGQIFLGGSTPTVSGIDIALRDLAPGSAAHLNAEALLFGGKDSRVKFEGEVGPFGPSNIPVDGTANLTIAPAEIPAAMRREQVGDWLSDPGASARVELNTTVQGDLYETLRGPAKLILREVQVGQAANQRLPLSGEAPAEFSVKRLMSKPATSLKVSKASLKLGSGEWKGDLSFSSDSVTRGSSAGSIRGVDVNQFLSAFTTAKDAVQGQLSMPEYRLSFAGKDAAAMKNSLAGGGKIELADGKVRAIDLLASIQRVIEKSSAPAGGETQFTTLKTDFVIGGQAINFSNIALASPVTSATGNGKVGFDQSLDFKLDTLVTGKLAELMGKRPEGDKPAQAVVPVQISGTVSSPKVLPNIKSLAVSQGLSLLDQLLKKKEPK